jgi:cellulose synthase/poly-beta-1,6-N-acetylglucosamine synthase-like glycosyltransferase/peptidoglycan/xylan/chitin deacetylase (PgdA/CDA1 family)/spore germination protein YaaH
MFINALTKLKQAKMEQEKRWKRLSSHNARQPLIGFYVSWDEASYASLRDHATRLDWLVAELMRLRPNDDPVLEIKDESYSADWVRKRNPNLKIFALINNFDLELGKWNNALLEQVLSDPGRRARLRAHLLDYVQRQQYAGAVIDFEDLSASTSSLLITVLHELKDDFTSRKLILAVTVPFQDPDFDYPRIAKEADYMILMAYDEHYPGGAPGPVASQTWFEETLLKRTREVDPHKMILAVGNYGYNWSSAKDVSATELSFQDALRAAQESSATVILDSISFNPHFEYDEDDGSHHSVWFLDAATLFNHLSAAEVYPLAGYGIWRLGTEDPSIWHILPNFSGTEETARKTLIIPPAYDLDFEGKGELLDVKQSSQEGARRVEFDPKLGLIKNEEYTRIPGSFLVRRRGFVPKRLVLTFDDGPDPSYTPEILRILREKKVPACFFVIGRNADLYPELLHQIYNEGHEVGNHTFTHPNLGTVSKPVAELEINTTQRLIQSLLQRSTILFRPPYGIDSTPATSNEIKPVMWASSLGYITVAQEIFSDDWRRPGADVILQRTLQQVKLHQRPTLIINAGNNILLHDGGGERSQTIEALPEIIDQLRAQGYQFVSLSSLLGMTRDQLMPPFSAQEQYLVRADHYLFLALGLIARFGHWIFLVVIVLGLARILFVGTLAVIHYSRCKQRQFDSGYRPKVSILIPCFNEAAVIRDTINSVLASNYKDLEVIVIDDGSSDNTADVVERRFAGVAKVRLLRQANAGKAAALNRGIAESSGEILIALDGDTQFLPNTIEKLVRHFKFPETGAAAGDAKVGNRINFLTACQALEYITSQNLDRRAFDLLNGITVVPGAVGAWRGSLVEELGGFESDTLAEDQELTMRILRCGKDVVYEPEAVAFTEAPDRLGGLIRQRFRWCYGTLQCVWKHRGAVFESTSGLGKFSIPNVVIFQILFPLLSPFMDLVLLWNIASSLFDKMQHDLPFWNETMIRVGFFYAVFVVVDWLYSLVAFLLEKEDKRLLLLTFLQRLLYRQLMYVVLFRSISRALTGITVTWEKLERKATVTR